jgi:hypothetical protein
MYTLRDLTNKRVLKYLDFRRVGLIPLHLCNVCVCVCVCVCVTVCICVCIAHLATHLSPSDQWIPATGHSAKALLLTNLLAQ